MGIGHTEAVAKLMGHVDLPAVLIDVARHHHADTQETFRAQPLVAIVVLPDTLTRCMGMALDFANDTFNRADAAMQALGLNADDVLRIAQAMPARVVAAQEMFKQTDRAADGADSDALDKKDVGDGCVSIQGGGAMLLALDCLLGSSQTCAVGDNHL